MENDTQVNIENFIENVKVNSDIGHMSELEVDSTIYLGDIKVKDFVDFLKEFPTEYQDYDEDGDYTIEPMSMDIALKEFIGAFADTTRIKNFANVNHNMLLKDVKLRGQGIKVTIKYDTIDKEVPF